MASTRGNSESASNYLEDYIETLHALPNEIRRYFELMRELDKEGSEVLSDLEDKERRVLADLRVARKGSRGGPSEESISSQLGEVRAKRHKAQQMSSEKVSVAEQACAECEIHLDRLDSELAKFEEYLRASGEFAAAGAAPGEQVAAKPAEEWILGRVQEYSIQTGVYVIMDEDDDTHTYEVSESLVVVLDGDRIAKGEEVLAVYPDTTSFYPAIVTSVPRRIGAGGAVGSAHSTAGAYMGTSTRGVDANLSCTVQFVDDIDENTGVTPDRVVSLKHIFKRQLIEITTERDE